MLSEQDKEDKHKMPEIKGVSPDAEIVSNERGGKQSKVEYGFHLCDYQALFALAEVLQIGASRYARDNWRKIPAEEHFNHMLIHSLAYLSGDKQDDHLGHMFCRAMMFYATAKAEEEASKGDPLDTEPPRPEQDEPEAWDFAVDEIRLDALCGSYINCDECPIPSTEKGSTLDCYAWAEQHPSEARAIMTAWEAEHVTEAD